MSKLIFRYGAMGSGKTANALMLKFNFEERGIKVLLVKPATDIRDGKGLIKSRCGLQSKTIFFEQLDDDIIGDFDILIVDEVQFLKRRDIDYLIHIVDDLGITVICYGLRTDFKGDLFEGSKYLLAWADKIEELKTICWCWNKATHQMRLDKKGNVIKDGEQVELGGNDKYVSLCRKHFRNEVFKWN